MMLAMARVLRNLPLFRLTIVVEGNVEPCRSPCVLVGNNELPYRGFARARGSIVASCAFMSPRHKAGCPCSGSLAVAFSG
jgi:hypothetical protein